MCDYILEHVKSLPAKVGDKLTTRDFGRVTRGFAASEDKNVAVCVLPGTELSFARDQPQDSDLSARQSRAPVGQSRRPRISGRPARPADVSASGPAGNRFAVTRGGEAACV